MIIHMSRLSEINIGSSFLSIIILAGFIATAFVFARLTIIGINYIKESSSKEEGVDKESEIKKTKAKGFN